jgi:hypothetical protein
MLRASNVSAPALARSLDSCDASSDPPAATLRFNVRIAALVSLREPCLCASDVTSWSKLLISIKS